uniref:Uncharacterized protein n=1 Tax=Amphimedon queenslandica TaxID=400682 RepID=A0A1X7U3L1_AMPQE
MDYPSFRRLFLLGKAETEECSAALEQFHKTCHQLGVPLTPESTLDPATTTEFLEIIFNTDRMVTALPEHKRQELRELLERMRGRKSATKEELQLLGGKLRHANKVVHESL